MADMQSANCRSNNALVARTKNNLLLIILFTTLGVLDAAVKDSVPRGTLFAKVPIRYLTPASELTRPGKDGTYDRQKYAAVLREAFEPFEQFAGSPDSRPTLFDSDFADDLSRSPLFAALRLLRPGD